MKATYLLAACLTLSTGCADSTTPIDKTTDQQIKDFWFSGAELNRYELTQSRYGQDHPGHAEFIFVTEPFDLADQVKSDRGGAGSEPVLKLNALRTFNTGLYSYRTMESIFTPTNQRDLPHVLKETLSVQDWCGQIFSQINRQGDTWNLQSFSYFQSDGDVKREIKASDAWLEEGFFNAARLNPSALPIGKFEAMPSQLYFRFAHRQPQVLDAVGDLAPDGKQMTYTVRYPEISRIITITFDKEFPHIIRAWTESNEQTGHATTAKLTHREMNVNYWQHNSPTDRAMRTNLGLDPVPN